MRIAALDLGTNSFHLLIADVLPDGHFEALAREKAMIRLGDVVARKGRITAAAADVAVQTVRRFQLMADAAEVTEVHACATSAIRQAANGDSVVDRIEAETGVAVEVISGQREAELIFGAIRASVLLEPAPALCFDLGGGSLEVMVGDAGGLRWSASENLGVGRLTSDLVRSDPLSKEDRQALQHRITEVLRPVAARAAEFGPRLVVGSSGTLLDLAHMVAARRRADVPVSLNQLQFTRQEFLALHKQILNSKASERLRMEGLEERRVDLVPAGSLVLAVAMDLFGFDEMTVSEWALREGIVLDVIGRHDPADWSEDPRAIRRASVQGFARRCNVQDEHARQVARLALELFDQTRELHHLGAVDRELLEYAALLHDVGEHISPTGHHKHGAYLIRHAQLRGFTPEEVQLLAALARWHRRGDPKPGDDFGMVDRGRLRRLAALLRIADGLDRSRSSAVDDVDVKVGPSLVVLRLRSAQDVELELWGTRRKRELFEKVFERDLELTSHPAGRDRAAPVAPAQPGPVTV
ncbi:MAG TPA: Ppx/GppA phosphatase family protein [Acidimicrobiia bacterium]|nr:Ppx/GppA phosphatase family protein [Acidimicrobiia bacterium]